MMLKAKKKASNEYWQLTLLILYRSAKEPEGQSLLVNSMKRSEGVWHGRQLNL
jgi:hypothetical protein